MLRIVVCDDEVQVFEQLREHILHCFMFKNIEYDIAYYSNASDLLKAKHDYDILFLDIMLGDGVDGIEIGKQLRVVGNTALFVLITSREDRAIDGYAAKVFSYLVKPVSREGISKVLDNLIEDLEYDQKKIAIKFKYETSYVHVKDIIYVESYSRKRYIVTNSERYETTASWQELLGQLSSYLYFFAPKRTYLINLKHVSKQSPARVIMKNGEKISFEKGKYEIFLEQFAKLLDDGHGHKQ